MQRTTKLWLAIMLVIASALLATAAMAEKQLLIANMNGGNSVSRYSLDGTFKASFSVPGWPYGICQGGDGNVYVGRLIDGALSKYSWDGTLLQSNLVTGIPNMRGVTWGNGQLWISCEGGPGFTANYDPITGSALGMSHSWGADPGQNAGAGAQHAKFGPDGRLYVANSGRATIEAWNVVSNTVEDIVTLGVPVYGDPNQCITVDVAFNGSDMYASDGWGRKIYKVDIATKTATVFLANVPAGGMVIKSGLLYVTSYADSNVAVYNLADGSLVKTIGSYPQIVNPQGICVLELPTGELVTMGGAKEKADGTAVKLASVVVTGSFSGSFYVEDTDRTGGIQVRSSSVPAADTVVTVIGVMSTDTVTGERFIQATQIENGGSGSVAPLGLTNKALGGGEFGAPGAGQAGVTGGVGLNNIGLLVKTVGRVSNGDANGFDLDDGSGVGLKVILPGAGSAYDGKHVSVVGISTMQSGGARALRALSSLSVREQTP